MHLSKEELVFLRWGVDLSSHLTSLRGTAATGVAPDMCAQHNKALSAYCQTCASCVCVNCALFGSHQGHAMRDVDEVYHEHVALIGSRVSAVRSSQARLLEQLQEIEKNVSVLGRYHATVRANITRHCAALHERIDEDLRGKVAVLMARKTALYDYTQQVAAELAKVDARLRSSERVGLILASTDLAHSFQRLQQTAQEDFNFTAVPADFANELIPPCLSFEVRLPRFAALQQAAHPAEPYLSETLSCGGLGWRLKVYPAGTQDAFQRFLSVYVELTDAPDYSAAHAAAMAGTAAAREMGGADLAAAGPGGSASGGGGNSGGGSWEAEYTIELLPPGGRPVIQRQFVSRFEPGECWGYERLCSLDLIDADGLLHADGALVLRLTLGLTSYQQIAIAQHWRIAALEQRLASEPARAPPRPASPTALRDLLRPLAAATVGSGLGQGGRDDGGALAAPSPLPVLGLSASMPALATATTSTSGSNTSAGAGLGPSMVHGAAGAAAGRGPLEAPELRASPGGHARAPVTYSRGMDRGRRDGEGEAAAKARTFRALSCSPFADDAARTADEARLGSQLLGARAAATAPPLTTPPALAATPTLGAAASGGGGGSASVSVSGAGVAALTGGARTHTPVSTPTPGAAAPHATTPLGGGRGRLLSPTEAEDELISLEAVLLDGPGAAGGGGRVPASPHGSKGTLKALSAALPGASPRVAADAAAVLDARPASLQQ